MSQNISPIFTTKLGTRCFPGARMLARAGTQCNVGCTHGDLCLPQWDVFKIMPVTTRSYNNVIEIKELITHQICFRNSNTLKLMKTLLCDLKL